MKLRCLACEKTFLYAAKKDTTKTIKVPLDGTTSEYTDDFETLEIHCCPFCGSLEIDEFVEPQPEVVDAMKTALPNVAEWVKQGWTVDHLYADHAVLIKKGEVEKTIVCSFPNATQETVNQIANAVFERMKKENAKTVQYETVNFISEVLGEEK